MLSIRSRSVERTLYYASLPTVSGGRFRFECPCLWDVARESVLTSLPSCAECIIVLEGSRRSYAWSGNRYDWNAHFTTVFDQTPQLAALCDLGYMAQRVRRRND